MKRKTGKFGRKGWMMVAMAAFGPLGSMTPTALATDDNWIAVSGGFWSVGSNWSLGTPPPSGNNADVDGSGTKSVNLDVDTASLNLLDVSSTDTFGTYTLIQSAHTITSSQEIVGDFGSNGRHTQSGGLNQVSNLTVGDTGAIGFYTLTNGGIISPSITVANNDSFGTFVQTGGSVTLASTGLNIGNDAPSQGYYSLGNTGSITFNVIEGTPNLIVGNTGIGSFVQSGSTSISDPQGVAHLTVANNSGSFGQYTLTSGNLSVLTETIGNSGTGTFSQSGGTNTIAGQLFVGFGSSGTGRYSLSGTGLLSVASGASIGVFGGGTMTQSGGTVNATDFLALDSSNSLYTLSGGSVTLSGNGSFKGEILNAGVFNQSGGTQTIGQTFIPYSLQIGAASGKSASFNLSNTGVVNLNGNAYVGGTNTAARGSGTLNVQAGGTMNVTGTLKIYDTTNTAVNVQPGGTLNVGVLDSTANQSRFFNGWSGGTLGITGPGTTNNNGTLSLGDHGSVVLNQTGGTISASGLDVGTNNAATYSLSNTGSLTIGTENIGHASVGSFVQSGGVNNPFNLDVGDNGSGNYFLFGGTLSTAGVASIGVGGVGTFTQIGGIATFGPTGSTNNNLVLGNLSSGEYDLGSAGSSVAVNGNEFVGFGSGSTGLVNQYGAGSSHIINGNLTIAVNSGAFGSFYLSGPSAQLTVTGNETLATSGAVFDQSNGFHNISGSLNVNAGLFRLGGGTLSFGSMTVSSGARFEIYGNNSFVPGGVATISGTGNGNGVIYNFSDTNTYAGAITLAADSTIGAAANSTLALTGGINKNGFNLTLSPAATGNINVNSVISGNADVIATGGGTVLLNVNNTYVGPTQVNGGATLLISGDGRLGAVPTSVNSTAITLNNGTLALSGSSINVNANRGFSIGSGGGTINILTNNTVNGLGPLSGPSNATMTKVGLGTWFMNGNSSNYFGKWIMTGGEVNPGNLATADLGWGAVPTAFTPDYFTLNNSNNGVTTGLRSGSGGSYQLNANRGITLGSGGGMLDAVNSATIMTIAPVISGTGSLILPGTNTGTIVLAASNTYTGTTEVRFGTLRVAPAGPWEVIPDVSDVLLTSNGTTFDLNGNTETIGSLAGNGLVILGGGTLTMGASGTSTSFNGVFTGSGLLNKSGGGTMTLSSTTSSYTGSAFNVNAGTLTLANSNAIPGTVTVNVANGATFAYANNSITFAGPVNNAGTVAAQNGSTVQIPTGGTSSGTYTTAAASTIAFTGGTENLTNANPISGSGIVQVSNATTVNTSSNLIVDNYLLNAQAGSTVSVAGTLGVGNNGTLTGGSGSGTVNVTGSLNVTHQALLGSTTGGSGTLSVIQSGALRAAGLTFNDLTVSDSATVTITTQAAGGDDPEINSSLVGGYQRDGAMTVTGGTVTAPNMKLGITSGKTGTYNQSGGTVNLSILGIGNDTNIGIGQGTGNVTISGGTMNATTILIGSTAGGSGDMTWSSGQLHATSLSLAQNGSMTITAGRNKTLALSTFSITGNAVLDLSDNPMILTYNASDTSHSVRDQIRNLLVNGRNGAPGQPGAWNGLGGITSSFAHNNGNGFNLAIGYGDNEDIALVRGSGSYTSFGGQTVASNTVLVQMTRGADATLDGVVDAQDVTILGSHFNKPNSGQWVFGDFDYSGTCDATDVTTLGSTFGKTTPTLSPAQMTAEFGSAFTQAFEDGQSGVVPEPASILLLGLGGLARMAARRRRGPAKGAAR